MKTILVFLAIGAGSSALAISAPEMGKRYFPDYKPVKSVYCDSLKTKFKSDKTSSMASFVVSTPYYMTTQNFKSIASEKDIIKDAFKPNEVSKMYGLEVQTGSFADLDSDFSMATLSPDIYSKGKQSASFYFERVDKYKTGVCIRVFTYTP